MKVRLLRLSVLSAAAATMAVVAPARLFAQSNPYERREPPPWLGQVTCKDDKERQIAGLAGEHEFRICFQVPEEKLYPRQDEEVSLDLVIKIYAAKEAKNLGLTTVTEERHDPNLIIEPQSGDPQLEQHGLAFWKTYKYRLRINNGLKPRLRRLKINGVIGNETLSEDYDLPIGAQGEGWVDIVNESQKPVTCWFGWRDSYCEETTLSLTNKLDYSLDIESVDLASDSPALVAGQSLTESMTLPDRPSPQTFKMTPRSQPISWQSIFSGFGKSPQLLLTIKFKDHYKRETYSKVRLDLQVKPDYAVLAIFLILGAVVGTIIRIDLGKLQRAGVITRKQKAVFAASTFATGALVCLILLFADVKLIAFNGDYSARDPKVLFFTALVATVSGLPILYALLKLPRQPKPDTKDENAPRRHGPRVRRDDQ
jgi:hypothetical protein